VPESVDALHAEELRLQLELREMELASDPRDVALHRLLDRFGGEKDYLDVADVGRLVEALGYEADEDYVAGLIWTYGVALTDDVDHHDAVEHEALEMWEHLGGDEREKELKEMYRVAEQELLEAEAAEAVFAQETMDVLDARDALETAEEAARTAQGDTERAKAAQDVAVAQAKLVNAEVEAVAAAALASKERAEAEVASARVAAVAHRRAPSPPSSPPSSPSPPPSSPPSSPSPSPSSPPSSPPPPSSLS
jgi:hypothetical protein